MDRFFTTIANRTAAFIGKPAAFVMALFSILLWAATGPLFGYSDTWQLVVNTSTTIITFLIVFLIQNSQNRDAAAIQAKLDELIRSVKAARNEFIGIEHLTDHQLELIRAELERESVAKNEDLKAAHAAVSRLINRN
jgi:low affinity Fe/Cu permease